MPEYFQPENVELRLDEYGNKKWYLSTRDGWQECGHDGLILELSVEHFSVGTKIELTEPVE